MKIKSRNKLLILAASTIVAATPIATVLSCGNSSSQLKNRVQKLASSLFDAFKINEVEAIAKPNGTNSSFYLQVDFVTTKAETDKLLSDLGYKSITDSDFVKDLQLVEDLFNATRHEKYPNARLSLGTFPTTSAGEDDHIEFGFGLTKDQEGSMDWASASDLVSTIDSIKNATQTSPIIIDLIQIMDNLKTI